MKNNWKLQEGNVSQLEKEFVEPLLNEYKEPGFVEIVNNRIYFYADIDREKTLVLTKNLKNLEDELITRRQVWGLSEIPTLHLHIQSPGGQAHAGFAMYDLIRNLQIPIYTYVNGVAASAATLLIIAGKKRFIYKNSFMMIHQVRSDLWGTFTHESLQDQMANDESVMEILRAVYLKETKLTEEKLDELLKHDLYFTAEQCLECGLVDHIIG